MATTREFKSLGIWADDATVMPPIPMNPLDTVAYRNEDFPQSENEEGELYNSITNSANFNQAMFIITSFIDSIDTHGTVGWSDAIDYDKPALTWADDDCFYIALLPSGPGTAIKDPANELNPTFWEKLVSAVQFELDLSSQVPASEGALLVGTTGMTVQENLDSLNVRAFNLRGLRTLLEGSFDEDGILLGNGFNIKDNIATQKTTTGGIDYFSVEPIDTGFGSVLIRNQAPRVTAQRTVNSPDTSNLLTANVYVIMGVWVAGDGSTIDADENTIKIVFSDINNVNITFQTPFTVSIRAVDRFRDDFSPLP